MTPHDKRWADKMDIEGDGRNMRVFGRNEALKAILAKESDDSSKMSSRVGDAIPSSRNIWHVVFGRRGTAASRDT